MRVTEEQAVALQAKNKSPGEAAKIKKLAAKHKRADHEHQEQVALFQWADYTLHKHPLLAMLYATPNGEYRPPAVANRLKKEGVRAGFPDVGLLVQKGVYHGLFIEMKRRKEDGPSSVSSEQVWWLRQLDHQGFKAVVCYGWEEARKTIKEYLKGGAR